MPTYTYECSRCRKVEEHAKSIKDLSVPSCCESPMERVIEGGGGVIFKGGGWVDQDLRRESQDRRIDSAVRRAKEIKTSGRAKMEDHLSFSDVERMSPE